MWSRTLRGLSGMVTVAIVVGVAGCAQPQVEEAVVVEEPEELAVRSFSEIEDLATLTDPELVILGDVGKFMAESGLIDIEISWGDDQKAPLVCNRKLSLWRSSASIYPNRPEGPSQVTWLVRLMRNDKELWKEGDSIFVEAKNDHCFAMEPFEILSPLRPKFSGEPTCWSHGENPVWWWYSVELRNAECSTDEFPHGRVAFLDPVVIIDPSI